MVGHVDGEWRERGTREWRSSGMWILEKDNRQATKKVLFVQ